MRYNIFYINRTNYFSGISPVSIPFSVIDLLTIAFAPLTQLSAIAIAKNFNTRTYINIVTQNWCNGHTARPFNICTNMYPEIRSYFYFRINNNNAIMSDR